MLATTVQIRQVGPFYRTPWPFDSAITATAGTAIGGRVQYYLAGDSVRIGNVVFLSARNTVKASATLTDFNNKTMGVVVGGTRTNMEASVAVADTSTLAAIAGERVIVLTHGRYWLLDSNAAGAPGTVVRGSGTAGRVAARLASIDSFNRNFAVAVDTIIAGKAFLAEIGIR